MKLLFLHGSPATGKLTVAKALLRLVPGRLFDNHASIDLARTLFDFGTSGFWELVHEVRYLALDAAATHGVPLVVMTFCFVEPDDLPQFQKFEEILQRHGGELLPVFLHCSREEALRRVGNPDRVERRKMTSGEYLNKYLDDYTFTAVPRAGCLTLDTGAMPAESAAREIIGHFGLTSRRCATSGSNSMSCRTINRARTRPMITASIRASQKPMMFLGDAHARSIQGPATMDGIGPTRGWETFWMEVDVKRRRSAPWAAPVPREIADKVRHLKAV